ncbi:MAG: TIGR02186 family protein [Caulobacterales bacterium]|nr:TIGR02186 family protein [Caulobacterales bacterium]
MATALPAAALALLLLAAPATARAQIGDQPRIALGLTEEEIRVTARFAGARIVVFGVARELQPGDDVVVTMRGPERPIQVSRKERIAGLWINGAPARFDGAPSFYASASTRPLDEIAPPDNLRRASIGAEHAPLRALDARSARFAVRLPEYRRAIVRAKTAAGLYADHGRGVEFLDEGLFRASVTLPAGAPTGDYEAVAYVFRAGRVAARSSIILPVKRQGLERAIHDLAHDSPLLYGLTAVLVALTAGWIGAVVFRRR